MFSSPIVNAAVQAVVSGDGVAIRDPQGEEGVCRIRTSKSEAMVLDQKKVVWRRAVATPSAHEEAS